MWIFVGNLPTRTLSTYISQNFLIPWSFQNSGSIIPSQNTVNLADSDLWLAFSWFVMVDWKLIILCILQQNVVGPLLDKLENDLGKFDEGPYFLGEISAVYMPFNWHLKMSNSLLLKIQGITSFFNVYAFYNRLTLHMHLLLKDSTYYPLIFLIIISLKGDRNFQNGLR